MLATILLDAYDSSRAGEVADAIQDLCAPDDAYGWSSAGVYAFWDPETREILYVGRSVDLHLRFLEHSGMRGDPDTAGKFRRIQEYFEHHERLGYSLVVQNALAQPLARRARESLPSPVDPGDFGFPALGAAEIRVVEGGILKAHLDLFGGLPLWNKIEGEAPEGVDEMEGNRELLEMLPGRKWGPLIARRTIRQLSNDPTATTFEEYLHAVREFMIMGGASPGGAVSFEEALATFPSEQGTRKRILESDYLGSRPEI